LHDLRRDDPRLELLRAWLRQDLGYDEFDIAPASADASFRRYFRVRSAHASQIAMDAPPGREDVGPYVAISGMLLQMGVHAPRVLERDAANGFLLLTDLGSTTYLAELADRSRARPLYDDALDALARIQVHGDPHARELPPYDEKLLRFEMSLFPDWFVGRHLGITLDDAPRQQLDRAFDTLVANALEQPRSFVHRDYHSRNLMVYPGDNPGVLDFQDAVHGPITYDLVSLLRDCYVAWPETEVTRWALQFRTKLTAAGRDAARDEARFLRWFDLMGVQRHLKAIGIFARLWHRDGKPGYLGDIPRTLGYVRSVSRRYRELGGLDRLIETLVVPTLGDDGQPRAAS
jgi:aminoglycoside/choline kinase family phosphotransferase